MISSTYYYRLEKKIIINKFYNFIFIETQQLCLQFLFFFLSILLSHKHKYIIYWYKNLDLSFKKIVCYMQFSK